jgi:hypothetical protein
MIDDLVDGWIDEAHELISATGFRPRAAMPTHAGDHAFGQWRIDHPFTAEFFLWPVVEYAILADVSPSATTLGSCAISSMRHGHGFNQSDFFW